MKKLAAVILAGCAVPGAYRPLRPAVQPGINVLSLMKTASLWVRLRRLCQMSGLTPGHLLFFFRFLTSYFLKHFDLYFLNFHHS